MTRGIPSVLLVTSLSAIGAASYCWPFLRERVFGSLAPGYSLVVGLYCFCWTMAICRLSHEIFPAQRQER